MPATIATRATGASKAKSKAKHGMVGVGKKSKTKDPACSSAMSSWKSSGMTHAISLVLAKCRAKANALRTGAMHREGGREAKAQVLEHRAATGKVGVEHRSSLARELIRKRQEQRASTSQPHGPSIKQQVTTHRPPGPKREARKSTIVAKPVKEKVKSTKIETKKASLREQAEAHRATKTGRKEKILGKLGSKFGRLQSEKAALATRAEMIQHVRREDYARGKKGQLEYENRLKELGKSVVKLVHVKHTSDVVGGRIQKVTAIGMKTKILPAKAKEKSKHVHVKIEEKSKPVVMKKPTLKEQAAAHRAGQGAIREASAKLLSRIKNKGPAELRDLRAELGYRIHDPKNPLKNPLHAAAKQLVDRGILVGTPSVMGGSITLHMKERAKKGKAATAKKSTKPVTSAPTKPVTSAPTKPVTSAPTKPAHETKHEIKTSSGHTYGSASHLDDVFNKSKGASNNFVRLDEFRKNMGGTREQQDAAIRQHRLSGVYSLDSHEGRTGPPLPQSAKDAAINEAGSRLVYISRRDSSHGPSSAPPKPAPPKPAMTPAQASSKHLERFPSKLPASQDFATSKETHQTFIEETRKLTGLKGDGARNGFKQEEYEGAIAAARDHDYIMFGEGAVKDYDKAMSKHPKDWDIKDARAVSVIYHEYTHTLGEHRAGDPKGVFLEEAATEGLARHAANEVIKSAGGSENLQSTMHSTGAYSAEVDAFRILADEVGIHPVEAARAIKNTMSSSRRRLVGEWLGAKVPHMKSTMGDAYNDRMSEATKMTRTIYGYEATPPKVMEDYRRTTIAFKKIATGVTKESDVAIRKAFSDTKIDWNDPGETIRNIDRHVMLARSRIDNENSTSEEVAIANEKLRVVRKYPFLTDSHVVATFA